jgi:preprotein translocase subunit YajC
MKTFNTLLFVQTTPVEGQNENPEQPVIEQAQAPAQEPHTTEPVPPPDSPPPAQSGKSWTNWVFLLLIIVVFYLFLIRPQSKRAKDERKFREALKKGDKIVTIAGIHGKILEIDETTAVIETEGQGKLRIEKAAIAKNQPA